MIINKVFKVFVVVFIIWFGATVVRGMVQSDPASHSSHSCCAVVITKVNDSVSNLRYIDYIGDEVFDTEISTDKVAYHTEVTLGWCKQYH